MRSNRFMLRKLTQMNRLIGMMIVEMVEELPPEEPAGATNLLERNILKALADEAPMLGKRIAKRGGYSYSARLRAALADMVRRGILAHGPDGYRLVSTQMPSMNGRESDIEATIAVNGKHANGFHRG